MNTIIWESLMLTVTAIMMAILYHPRTTAISTKLMLGNVLFTLKLHIRATLRAKRPSTRRQLNSRRLQRHTYIGQTLKNGFERGPVDPVKIFWNASHCVPPNQTERKNSMTKLQGKGGGGGKGGSGKGQGNGGGWPSGTGNPSGGGRSNAPSGGK